ncbi:hypothetical protein GW17_00054140, partial [Ensete ventricosum]
MIDRNQWSQSLGKGTGLRARLGRSAREGERQSVAAAKVERFGIVQEGGAWRTPRNQRRHREEERLVGWVRRMAPIGKESLVIRADATMVEKKAATSKRSCQRRGPRLWPERALAVIFEVGEEVEEAEGEADTISANNSLSGSQTISSTGGNFVLGFFKPGNSSSRYYVGIWYKKVSTLTTVWVANRETPVADQSTSELRIAGDGNLVLLNQSKSIVWSTDANISSNSTLAVLLDNGNLQLRDESNESQVFWQSFDNPTNTWLPGGKVGLNKVTNRNQHLTAWKNDDDPAPGIFSLELDPNGTSQYFILWNMTTQYWTSGIWNGQIFSRVPEMTANYIYDFEYISNSTENYFTYTVKDNTIISRFVMDVSGQIKQLTWLENSQTWILFWSQPRQQCQVYSFCGSFGSCNENALPYCKCVQGFSPKSQSDWDLGDQSEGCVRNTLLQCGRSDSSRTEKDGFLPMSNMRLPMNSRT